MVRDFIGSLSVNVHIFRGRVQYYMYSLTEEARKNKQIPGKARKTDKKVRRKNLQPQPLHFSR